VASQVTALEIWLLACILLVTSKKTNLFVDNRRNY